MDSFCPVTGCKVFSRPEWINKKVSDTFIANFWIVGNSTIYSLPKGKADLEGVKNSTNLKKEVAKHISEGNGPFIQIQDYAALNGSTHAARSHFINDANEDERLRTMIFCNLAPPLAIAVKIGKRFNTAGKDIHIVKRYSDAIKLSLKFCDPQHLTSDAAAIDFKECFDDIDCSLTPVELLSEDAWNIETPEFSNRVVVINRHILYSTSEGYFERDTLPLIDRMRDLCQAAIPKDSNIEYIVADFSKLRGASRLGRINYMKSLKNWHQKNPFKMYIVYGANTYMRTALHLARPLMPFQIKIAKDIKHAFRLTHKDRTGNPAKKHEIEESEKPVRVSHKDIDELLSLIGLINWEQEGIDINFDIGDDHSFYFLYKSIKLIKEELDDLFMERKQLESQLHQSRKMESIGTLTGGIAHDFNNILGIIIGNTELALDIVPEDNPAHLNLEEIQTAGLRAKDIVRQLLGFSRKTELTLKPISIVPVIEDALKFLRSTIPTTFDIRQHIYAEDKTILGDRVQIYRMMMNLCLNASQSMEHTGGVIEITVASIHLDTVTVIGHSELNKGDYLRIAVSDTGPGIAPEIIDRIFDPYFTTKEAGKGSGMGLAVVHGIAKNHHGAVSVESKPGKGTTFNVLFPVTTEKSEIDATTTGSLCLGSETVLLVDDEALIVEMTRRMLERLGYRVKIALSPHDALEQFSADPNHFDLVITDMTMPEMTGVMLSEKIMKIRQDVPVIICTGYSDLLDEERAKQLGIAAYVMKPIHMIEISKIIRNVLDEPNRSARQG